MNAALDMLPARIRSTQRKALAVRQDTQPAAYEAYIRGRGYLQEYEKPENIDNAITEFNQAIKIDPNYAPAYAALGKTYWAGFQQLDAEKNGWPRPPPIARRRCRPNARFGGSSCLSGQCV